ncbi:hypothetical protein [Streptomyces atroolivaceus]|uniref:hypothetical protein n=1 Tax=Streptomyces atroolivaceus TaxID=66869 RepID=UPI0037B35772
MAPADIGRMLTTSQGCQDPPAPSRPEQLVRDDDEHPIRHDERSPYGRRLLAAVPEPGLRRSLAARLRASGYLVEAGATGAAALGSLGQQCFDLIIELLARVQVLLRAKDAAREPVLRHEDLILDEVVCQAWRGDGGRR